MSRRKQAPKRDILPDPLFGSDLLSKFINVLMQSGKKSIAETIVYGALEDSLRRIIKNPSILPEIGADDEGSEGGEGGEGGESLTPSVDVKALLAKLDATSSVLDNEDARAVALEVFKMALKKITPMVEVKSRRVGGSTYQVPVNIHAKRRMALAMRWMVEYSAKRSERTMVQRLANEILDALSDRGGAAKKREDVYRMAKANQAFAHFRW